MNLKYLRYGMTECAVVASFVILALAVFGQTLHLNDVRELSPNQAFERELTGTETHRYKFDLQANEFFQVRVEQKGVDVALKLVDAGGNVLATMDSPNGKQGPETISFIAEKSAAFALEVSALDTKAEKGSYSIRREASRAPTPKDQRRVEVERVFVEGLTARNTTGQQEVAVTKLESAVRGWEELQDPDLTFLSAIQLFIAANQWPEDTLKEAMRLLMDGREESLLESRKQSFRALELFRRFGQQLDGKTFTDLLIKIYGEKAGSEKAGFKFKAKFGEVNTLSNISNIYAKTGEFEKSLKYKELGITVIKEVRLNPDMISSKSAIAIMPAFRVVEASIVSSIGTTLTNSLDKPKEGLDYLNRSLILFREIQRDDTSSKEFAKFNEGLTLQTVGTSYYKLDNIPEALRCWEQALQIIQAIPKQKSIESSILLKIATAHFKVFNYEQSLAALNQILKITKETGDIALKADALSYIRTIYFDLGDEKALRQSSRQEIALLLSPEYLESLVARLGSKNIPAALSREVDLQNESYSPGEFYKKQYDVLRLVRIGNNYKLIEEFDDALKYYEQALAKSQGLRDSSYEGIVSTQLADLYIKRKQWDKAVEYYQRSLTLERQRGIKTDLAVSLRDVGYAYLEAGKPREALPYFNQSLAIWYALGADKTGTVYRLYGTVLSHISRAYSALGNRRLAIVFGTLAVNAIQRERGQLGRFDRSLQVSFLQKNEKPYRRLADWLIAAGRLPEAEQVLRMLKEDEYFRFIRRDASEVEKLSQRADLRPEEASALKRYNEISGRLTALGEAYAKLETKRNSPPAGATLSPPEKEQHTRLAKDIEDANNVFQVFLRELADEFTKTPKATKVKEDSQQNAGLSADLKRWRSRLGIKGVVALYTVLGEDRYRVILTTPDVQTDGKTEIKAELLREKIARFRQVVTDPKIDPRPLGKELYDIIVKPVEKQLAGANATTILWSLDDTLRYVPLAALWDGEHYLGEKYQNVVITLASRTRLGDKPSADWGALGLGVSETRQVSLQEPDGTTRSMNFVALPGVLRELQSIVRDETSRSRETGILPGKRLLDATFTEAALKDSLGGRYKVVHIASHFSFRPGDLTRSFLLLGDGSALTLNNFKTSPQLAFTGVELLTLSACDTAIGEANADGVEIESFGVIAQETGAQAVLATLWSVADESTQLLMSKFYRLHKANPRLTKAAALQLAQQRMIEGKLQPDPLSTEPKAPGTKQDRKSERVATEGTTGAVSQGPPFPFDLKKPYAHPYYWAPFILIGNWK